MILRESFSAGLVPSARQIDVAARWRRTGVFGGALQAEAGRVAQSGTRGREAHGQSASGLARRILNLTPPSCHPRRLSPTLVPDLIGDPVKEWIQAIYGDPGVFAFPASCEENGTGSSRSQGL